MKNILQKEEVISFLKEGLNNEQDILMVFLFGSVAAGRTFKEDSDIDIGIWMREPYTRSRFFEIWNRVEEKLNREAEVALLNTAKPYIVSAALRAEKVIIRDWKFYYKKLLMSTAEAEDMREFVMSLWKLKRRWSYAVS